jgi:hypothetical protein
MSAREQLYHFETLDIHAAIIIQQAIEARKDHLTNIDGKVLQKGDKALKATVEELDQMYDDLDRHIASSVRRQEYDQKTKNIEARDTHFKQVIGE